MNTVGDKYRLNADQLRETIPDDGLERWPDAGASFNIGIMLFRPESKEFVGRSLACTIVVSIFNCSYPSLAPPPIEAWITKLEDPKMWDQTAFNDLSRMQASPSNSSMKNLWWGYQHKLIVGILPASIFASGHMFFVQVWGQIDDGLF